MSLSAILSRAQADPRKLSPREAYEELASRYDHIPNPMIALEQEAMAKRLPMLEGLTVADLGCGTGRYAAQALASGAATVYALDLSDSMLGVACSRLQPEGRLRAIQGDMQRLPLRSGCLDGVISGLALGYAPRLGRAISEMSRVLKPGGFALISDLHPIGPSLGWEREYTLGTNGDREKIIVEHYPYSFEHLFEHLYDAGLFLEELHEVPVGDSLGPFAHGWRDRRRLRRIRHVPAVAVYLLRKEL